AADDTLGATHIEGWDDEGYGHGIRRGDTRISMHCCPRRSTPSITVDQKEVLRHLWDCSRVREARRHFKSWAKWCRKLRYRGEQCCRHDRVTTGRSHLLLQASHLNWSLGGCE